MSREGWHPDPFGRVDERFHDGRAWTPYGRVAGEPVLDQPDPGTPPEPVPASPSVPAPRAGEQGYDADGGFREMGATSNPAPLPPEPPAPAPAPPAQAPERAEPVPMATGPVLAEPVLVLREGASDRYEVLRPDGALLARVIAEGQTRIDVVDGSGAVLLSAERRPGASGDDVVTVRDGDRSLVGRLVRAHAGLRQHYDVELPDGPAGRFAAVEAKEHRYRVVDVAGAEIASTVAGVDAGPEVTPSLTLVAHHVLVFADTAPEPLRALALAGSVLAEPSARPLRGLRGYLAPAPGWQL